MAKLCDEGETLVGNVFLKGDAQPSFYLGLYKNSSEPAETAVMTDITEAQTPGTNGYARIALGDADWTEGAAGVFTNLEKSFTADGGDWGDIYGYFITTESTGTAGDLVAVEQFSDGPYDMADGNVTNVTPKITVS